MNRRIQPSTGLRWHVLCRCVICGGMFYQHTRPTARQHVTCSSKCSLRYVHVTGRVRKILKTSQGGDQ